MATRYHLLLGVLWWFSRGLRSRLLGVAQPRFSGLHLLIQAHPLPGLLACIELRQLLLERRVRIVQRDEIRLCLLCCWFLLLDSALA